MNRLSETDMTAKWNALHAKPHFSPRFPIDSVIRWTFKHFPREQAGAFSLLDAGAGMGRHAIFWAREGYCVTATDVSPLAISQAIEWRDMEKLDFVASIAEADALPLSDESFDGVLSYGVLYYLSYAQMRRAIAEMWRVLKPGGRSLVMVKSDADSRRDGAEVVDRWSYRVGALKDGAYWGAEVGMVLTLLDRAALEQCFSAFSEVVIDRSSVTASNGRFVDDDWLIQLRK